MLRASFSSFFLFLKRYSIIWLLLCLPIHAHSQTFPVANNVQLLPPYSIYLQDYVSPGSEQLKLHLLLRDLNEPFHDVRLHMRIEGTAVVIENSPFINVTPISVEGGVPLTLTASDLAPYFNINTLNFSGISKNEFQKNGKLPEGYYRFCFTVIDYQRPDVQLSANQCATVWIVQNDPPRLNMPFCESEVALTEAQSISFQWTAMHTSSPNAAQDTEYKFQLYEIRPEGRNPNDVVLSSRPIYEETTSFPNLFYGPSEPALIPGMEYVWRVQAVDLMGRDLFKNNGFSESCTFTFGENIVLEPPSNIVASAEAQRRARISWETQTDPTGYEVAYRKAEGNYDWFTTTTENIEALINDLEPNTSYEAQVTSLLNNYKSDPSGTVYFTTPAPPEFSCGDEEVIINNENFIPLKKAFRGRMITVGQFEMRLLKVEGQDGIFSGIGSMIVPYLSSKITCKFTNIKINENHEMVEGEVMALTTGMAEILEDWAKLPPDDEDLEDSEGSTENDTIPGGTFNGQHIPIEGIIDNITIDTTTNTITVHKEDGTSEEYDLENDTAEGEGKKFTDEEGNEWFVDGEGNVYQKGTDEGDIDNSNERDSILYVQKELIKEVLDHYKEEINLWLENSGKGPLEETLIKRLMNLPDCLPESEEELEAVIERIEYFEENREELIALIESNEAIRDRFRFLVNKLNGEQPPYVEGLTEEEWDELLEMACPYLLPEQETQPSLIYDHFIADDDAWLRKTDDPETFITPTEKAVFGTQVSLLEELQVNGKDVAKLKIKGLGDTIFITNRSDYLVQVENLSKELKYKMKKDYTAVKLPYATAKSDKTYKENTSFIAYKKCGDYVKVKGEDNDEIEGYWIEKSTALVDCGTGFCCQECGKDLTLTLTDLQTIYGSKPTSEYVTHLNTALKKGDFNTCTSHAHFFSQSQAEVGSKFSLDEIPNYRLHTVLELHRNKQSLKDFYKQSFWDDETYLDYFQFYVFKEAPDDYKGSKFKGGSEKTFTWGPNITKSIKVPTLFTVKKDEKYQKVIFTNAEKEIRNKKLFSYLYANRYENGAPSTEDGWKFRGRGLIHLTWRENYRKASAASGDKLDYSVNWETNYKNVNGQPKDAVYSSVAYFLFKLNTEEKFNLLHDNTKAWEVSKWVNGLNPSTKEPNGWPGRRDNFNTLIGDLFKCDK